MRYFAWLLLLVALMSVPPQHAWGVTCTANSDCAGEGKGYICAAGQCKCAFGKLEAPLNDTIERDICKLADPANKPLLTLFGTLALFITGIIVATGVMMVMASGYLYMTAGGNAAQVSKAKTMITTALLGIILALAAYVILTTISKQFSVKLDEGTEPILILPTP